MKTTTRKALYLLARHHGHEWGMYPSVVFSNVGFSHDEWCEGMREVTSRNIFPGIGSPPKIGESHTTLTGRVKWWADAQGVVTVQVQRPAGVAFEIRITQQGVIWGYPERSVAPEARHYETLRSMLVTLTGEWRDSAHDYKGFMPLASLENYLAWERERSL